MSSMTVRGSIFRGALVAVTVGLVWACSSGPASTGDDERAGAIRSAYIDYTPEDVGPLAGCTVSSATQSNIAYSTRNTAHPVENKFDFYPCNPANPVVVFVHGGGWKGGAKEVFASVNVLPTIQALQALGYNVISTNYSLVPGVTFPRPLEDIKCLLSFLAEHTSTYGNMQKLVMWGHSVGAHLALLASYTTSVQFGGGAGCGSTSTAYRVIRAIGSSGPIDLTEATGTEQTDVKNLLGLSRWFSVANTSDAIYVQVQNASPLTYATSDGPFTLLLSGQSDGLIPPTLNSKKLSDRLGTSTSRWVNYPSPTSHNDIYVDTVVPPSGTFKAKTEITNLLTPPPGCGDGVVTFPEVCDDGNASSCGTCSADCKVNQPANKATGSITALACAAMPDGTTITLKDGFSGQTTVFEIDRNGSVAAGRTRINCPAGNTASQAATLIAQAINGVADSLNITATASGTKVNLASDLAGSFGNQAITTSFANLVVTGMSGGTAGDCGWTTGCTGSGICGAGLVCSLLHECELWDE